MNWKIKSVIQKCFSILPDRLGDPVYFSLQNKFGNVQTGTLARLKKANEIIKSIQNLNYDIKDKTFLEIGTGWTLDIPIGLWLCGVKNIISIDKNTFLKDSLVIKSIDYILKNKYKIIDLMSNVNNPNLINKRISEMESCNLKMKDIFKLLNIKYMPNTNVTDLRKFKDDSIDFHYSVHVLEHIPASEIIEGFIQAKRVLKRRGLLIHHISMSDHFSHDDKSISAINFLKYSDKIWKKYIGSKYNYHNRLRIYDYYKIFNDLKINILLKDEYINLKALEVLNKGFQCDAKYLKQDFRELATSGLKLIGKFN